MKAAIRSRGRIIYSSNHPKPKCSSRKILIRVKAAAINPADYKIGWPILGTVVGFDFAGVVEEKGANVTENFNVGDEVYGFSKNGSLAEFLTVNPSKVALMPRSLSFVEAAAMPVTYLTALQGLRDYGKVQAGDRVLVIGASGGCGTAVVQLAKSLGARDIVGVCSSRKAGLVKSLGATDIIDYAKRTVREYCQNGMEDVKENMKFDVIYDAASGSGAGEDYKNISMEHLRKGRFRHGQYVAMGGNIGMWLRFFSIGFKPNQHLFLLNVTARDLEYLAKVIDECGVKPVIAEDLRFNAKNLDKGFSLLKSRRTVGKIVFRMYNRD